MDLTGSNAPPIVKYARETIYIIGEEGLVPKDFGVFEDALVRLSMEFSAKAMLSHVREVFA